MNKIQRLLNIQEKCEEIINSEVRANLPDFFYWILLDLIDIEDEDFIINLYRNSSDAHLEVLTETIMISNIIEVSQSSRLLSLLKEYSHVKNEIISELVLFDAESALFEMYDPDDKNKCRGLKEIYQLLRNKLKEIRDRNETDESTILADIDSFIMLVSSNQHPCFKGLYLYWLRLYLAEIYIQVEHKEELKKRKNILTSFFPTYPFR
jgi:hypothetical protein